jgi:MFS family permease
MGTTAQTPELRDAPRSPEHAAAGSTTAIWLVCVGVGLLFLARGAFQPYAFPLFEHLGGLGYAQIALILNGYVLAQSICAPLAGWYTDRTSARTALATGIAFGVASFVIISTGPPFPIAAAAVVLAGFAFVLGRISLNTILVLHSSPQTLRRSVAKRATLLNLGSFVGNSVAVAMTKRVGYGPHAVLLALLHLPLVVGLFARSAPRNTRHDHAPTDARGAMALLRNRGFLADALRRFAMVLPYGCWGTIIPKYVIDQYHSNDPVWIVYLTSLCTTIAGAHFLAVYVSGKLYSRGFRWEWWSMVSVILYCAGLVLLVFAGNPVMLPLAVVVFICGEVVMTPCFDEAARRHSADASMGTCLGLLHLVDGLGRMLGGAFALAVYGGMRNSAHRGLFWPVVVVAFLCVSTALHAVAHGVGKQRRSPAAQDAEPVTATV